MRHATVIHQGALGDFILSLPVYSGLHWLYPALRIHFWSKPVHAALLSHQPYFGGSTSCDSTQLNAFYLDQGRQDLCLDPVLAKADAVFWFGQESSRVVAERLRVRLKQPVIWVQSFPDPFGQSPVSDFLIRQVRAAGYPIACSLPELRLGPEQVEAWSDQLKTNETRTAGWVVVHPGSGGLAKIWPLARWAALVRQLLDVGHSVMIVLGPADEPLLDFAEAMRNSGCSLCLDPELPQLAAILCRSRLTVGNDSGVSHLAAALGVPTIAVFGPASPAIWRPRGTKVQVLTDRWDPSTALAWPGPIEPGPVSAVTSAILERLGAAAD